MPWDTMQTGSDPERAPHPRDDAAMSARAISLSTLPVVRFATSRAFFVTSALISLFILEWIRQLRDGPDPYRLSDVYFLLFVSQDYFAAIAALLILVCAIFVPTRVTFRSVLRWS